MINQPKKFFTVIALIFGVIFATLLPPGHIPDEPNHFFKAHQVAQGVFTGIKKEQRLGGFMPKEIIQIFLPFRKLRYHYDERVKFEDFQKAALLQTTAKQQFIDFPNTAIYSPLGYFPQALGISILQSLKLRPLYIFYITRFITLLVWIGLIRLSIHWIPFGKWLLVLLALLPSSLWIHCGVSADMMTNGISFLLIAWFIKTISDPTPPKRKAWVIPILFSGFLASTKVAYMPIFLLSILIPNVHFSNLSKCIPKTNKILFIGVGLLINLLIISNVYYSSKSNYIPYEEYNPTFRVGQQLNEGANPNQQLNYIIDHPVTFSKAIITSYIGSSKATMAHYFGKFGWEKNYLPAWLVGLLLLTTLLLGLSKKTNFLPFQQFLFIAIGLIMMTAFASLIYLQWSSVGSNKILNLAGRYMFPIFPLFYLALPPFLNKHHTKILRLAQATILLSLCTGIWFVILRYY